MKRSHDSATDLDTPLPEEEQPVPSQPKQVKCLHCTDLESTVEQACYQTVSESSPAAATDDEKYQPGDILLPPCPLIFLGLDEDAQVDRLGYWPPNTEMGMRVLKVMDDAVGQDTEGLEVCSIADRNIRLLDELWHWTNSNGKSCENPDLIKKHFNVESIAELGIFREVIECKRDYKRRVKKGTADGVVLLDHLSTRVYTKVYHRYC